MAKRLLECSFLIPIHRDKHLSDGRPHADEAWNWLDNELTVFGGATSSTVLYEGWYVDQDTKERVNDLSWKYYVALPNGKQKLLRSLLQRVCRVFQQKSIYLSIAGQVEFVEASGHEKK